MVDLNGKRALVTGGAVRVGRQIALALGSAGMHVAVHYRSSAEQAGATCAEIQRAGGCATALPADIEDRNQARKLVDRTLQALGGLDLLVASAASFERIAYDAIDDASWDRTLGLNLSSQFALAQHATPALRASRGSIVFITCSSATTPFKNHLPYVVSKGALQHLTRVLALELAPEVRVNAVAPGTVQPPDEMPPDVVSRLAERVPLRSIGSPEDIARAVLFLAQSPFITGHEIAVDGGRSVANVERFG
jgi:pteridine reductase